PPTQLERDIVKERTVRDMHKREIVARPDVGTGAGLSRRTDAEPGRREDVALRTVRVVKQRDARRTVRVVLDRGHLRRDPVLPALEVDHPVAALVATALMAGRDATHVVAPALLSQLCGQRLVRLRLRDLLERRDGHEAAARRRRFVAADWHD